MFWDSKPVLRGGLDIRQISHLQRAYGTFEDLVPINWTMADDTTYTIATTRNEIIANGVSVHTELQNAKEWVTRAVRVVDATNAQLALGGMYVN